MSKLRFKGAKMPKALKTLSKLRFKKAKMPKAFENVE